MGQLNLRGTFSRAIRRPTGLRLLRIAVRTWPDLERAHRILLEAAERRRRWAEALVYAREIVRLQPDDYNIQIKVGRYLFRLGFRSDAAAALEAAREVAPHEPLAHELLGDVYRELGRPRDARACYAAAAQRSEEPVRLTLRIGRSLEAEGLWDEARERYEAAREVATARRTSPQHFDDWIEVERHLAARGRPEEALAAALCAFPSCDRVPDWLVALARRSVLDADLLQLAERLRAAEPDAPWLWFVPVHRQIQDGRLDEARAVLLSLDPTRREDPAWSVAIEAAQPRYLEAAPLRSSASSVNRELGVVSCYFNPCDNRARFENYELFHKHVEASGVRLLTVELAFGDREFELAHFQGVLGLRGGDVMWQKERLLDIGIRCLLEEGFEKIAWLDCDLFFERSDWAERVAQGLDEHALCHAFDLAHIRARGGDPGAFRPSLVARSQRSPRTPGSRSCVGFAWAARADVLRRVPLYDAAVSGGADRLIYFASHAGDESGRGVDRYRRNLRHLPDAMSVHYQEWAGRWSAAVRGDVGYVAQPIVTLYHGPRAMRGYTKRFDLLGAHGFAPERDLALDPASSTWKWTARSPALHRAVEGWFRDREGVGVRSSLHE